MSVTYHAKVEFKDPDGNIIDSDLVECAKLETNGQATRSKTLSAPTKAGRGARDTIPSSF